VSKRKSNQIVSTKKENFVNENSKTPRQRSKSPPASTVKRQSVTPREKNTN